MADRRCSQHGYSRNPGGQRRSGAPRPSDFGAESGQQRRRGSAPSYSTRSSSPAPGRQHRPTQNARRQPTHTGGNPYSRGSYQRKVVRENGGRAPRAGSESYRSRQLSAHAPKASNYERRSPVHAHSVAASQMVSQRGLIGRIVVIVVLLLVLVLRFSGCAGSVDTLNDVSVQVADQQSQLDDLTSSNTTMQTQMDSMQSTIDTYTQRQNNG